LALLDSTAGICVGIGFSVFQDAGFVYSDPSALAAMVSGIYIITNAWIISCLLYSPLAASPTFHHRPILALIGTMMAGSLAVTVLVTVLLKPKDNRQHT
jgi:ABC-type thiamin/hydroxymethylpyrimidine transport system permease subunit